MPIVGIDLTEPGLARGVADGVAIGGVGVVANQVLGKAPYSSPALIPAAISSVLYDFTLAGMLENGLGEYPGAIMKGAAVGGISVFVDSILGMVGMKFATGMPMRAWDLKALAATVAVNSAVSAAILPAGRFVGNYVPPMVGMPPVFENGVKNLATKGAGAGAAALHANARHYPLAHKP